MKAQSEERATYIIDESFDDETINNAINIVYGRIVEKGDVMSSPAMVKTYLTLKLANLEHEVFTCLFLDAQNRVISYDELFRGSVSQTSVYPREVVKTALRHNAAAVIFAHNHPSGFAEPSRADQSLTTELKTALKYVDVAVLDHFIIAGSEVMSFAEKGLL